VFRPSLDYAPHVARDFLTLRAKVVEHLSIHSSLDPLCTCVHAVSARAVEQLALTRDACAAVIPRFRHLLSSRSSDGACSTRIHRSCCFLSRPGSRAFVLLSPPWPL
jgi:hypothetical protein